MTKSTYLFTSILLGLLISFNTSHAQVDQTAVDDFIENIAFQQKRPLKEVDEIIKQAVFDSVIIEKITRPAEKMMTWERYRGIFLTTERIDTGVVFWQKNEEVLNKVSQETGVAVEALIGILGVETYFGRRMGTHRVLDALYTLAFGYPRRSSFFKAELSKYLELCEKEGLDPLTIKGSYTGAMGYGQFIPSSYLAYAKSYDSESGADLVNEVEDGIASVANYLKVHRWVEGGMVALRAEKTEDADSIAVQEVKPSKTISFYESKGYKTIESVDASELVSLQIMQMEDETQQYWVTGENFYVITRYNHSSLYALAVFQLGQAVKNARQSDERDDQR